MEKAFCSSRLLALSIVTALILSGLTFGFRWQQRLDVMTVHVASLPLIVEVASDPSSRATGLKHRTSLPPNGGMLFVFPGAVRAEFWMKETLIDLDIGFFDDQLQLIDICQMTALDVRSRCIPCRPAKYALEVNQGWFAANRIPTTARLQLPRLIEAR